MTDLKTPYLDREIELCEFIMEHHPSSRKVNRPKVEEYQQIKAALKRLEKLEKAKFRMPNASDLKAMRKNLWFSMGQVEKACGVSKSTISRIEKGKDADYSNVKKLVEFYQSQPLPNQSGKCPYCKSEKPCKGAYPEGCFYNP